MARTTLDSSSRRTFLAGALATVAAASLADSKVQAQSKGSPFVLVHGAWHGGWCWRRVSDRLQAAGHRVFCPTLTGLGERAHLLSREVNMTTHISDVVGLLEAEELEGVVLVGHSYGGIVITGV